MLVTRHGQLELAKTQAVENRYFLEVLYLTGVCTRPARLFVDELDIECLEAWCTRFDLMGCNPRNRLRCIKPFPLENMRMLSPHEVRIRKAWNKQYEVILRTRGKERFTDVSSIVAFGYPTGKGADFVAGEDVWFFFWEEPPRNALLLDGTPPTKEGILKTFLETPAWYEKTLELLKMLFPSITGRHLIIDSAFGVTIDGELLGEHREVAEALAFFVAAIYLNAPTVIALDCGEKWLPPELFPAFLRVLVENAPDCFRIVYTPPADLHKT